MNPVVRHSLVLLGLLLLLVSVDISLFGWVPSESDEHPWITEFESETLESITLVRGETKVSLKRDSANSWSIVEPFSASADQAAIDGILGVFRSPVRADLLVEANSERLDSYGLESPAAILITFSGPEPTPPTSFYIGHNTSGGASFIRFPDSATVYRAKIGGRHRYEQPPRAWINPVVAAFDPTAVQSFHIRGKETLTFQRQPGEGDGTAQTWQLAQDPSLPLDTHEIDGTLTALSALRGGDVFPSDHPAGMEQPTAVVRIEFTNAQEPIELTFGRTLNGAFVRALEKPKIYQIAPSFTAQLSRPKAGWYNRQLFQFRRAAIHRLTLDEELGGVTILEQDPANSSWKVIQPRNVDANMRDCMQAAQALSNLRADGISTLEAAAAGFPSKNSMTIELLSGTRYTLEFGNRVPGMPEGRESLFVRTSDTPDRIAAVSIRTLLMIRTAFSR